MILLYTSTHFVITRHLVRRLYFTLLVDEDAPVCVLTICELDARNLLLIQWNNDPSRKLLSPQYLHFHYP